MQPLGWKRPSTIFVNSMSDLFHVSVPEDYIREVFSVMGQASWHQFQLLTKRADRLERVAGRLKVPSNVWLGVSVESPMYYSRIRHLSRVAAQVRFLSCEPLLAPLPDLPLDGIHWVIVGGESGSGARPMEPEWVRDIQSQCSLYAVPFFFKQWGGVQKKRFGRTLDGLTWDAMPVASSSEAMRSARGVQPGKRIMVPSG
jgi:protein gp37